MDLFYFYLFLCRSLLSAPRLWLLQCHINAMRVVLAVVSVVVGVHSVKTMTKTTKDKKTDFFVRYRFRIWSQIRQH